jgi:deazaflavin-dependent oxidoreductase (nitroreductase family)
MPHDLVLKGLNAVHRLVLWGTGGRVGYDVVGMPVLELTTVGRRSGQPRSVMLTSPLQEGDTIVVVASRGGDDQHPAWYLNLLDQPRVEVAFKGGSRTPMNARMATAEERARMWPVVTAKYRGYGDYQKRTSREIPLVLLEPVS